MEKLAFTEVVAAALRQHSDVDRAEANEMGSVMVDLKDGSVYQLQAVTVIEQL